MRRSEFLKLLETALYKNYQIQHGASLAELMLKTAEDAGMLPASAYYCQSGEYSSTEDVLEELELTEYVTLKWEPEDEKN